jgi:hypothetical protein
MSRTRQRPFLAAALLLTTTAAAAEGVTAPSAASEEEVSGVLVRDEGPGPSVAGVVLVAPRLMVAAAAVPVRQGLIFYERHNVRERLLDLFFDDSRQFGIYPIVGLETGLRPGFGVRVVHRDLAGTGARLRLAGDYGGELRRRVDAALTTPALGGAPLWLHLRGGWQRQPDATFYGIGDEPLGGAPGAGQPARGSDAYHARFDQEIARAELGLLLDPRGPLHVGWAGTWVSRRFGGRGSDPHEVAVHFDPATLTGWDRGVKLIYNEAQVGLDTLRVANPYIPAATPSQGTKVVAFAGWAAGVGGDPTRYLRYGVDALQYVDLYAGDRVLLLRGHLEGVAGDDDRIPFTDLPRLGGPSLLRGFAPGRFRDRLAASATAEYRYPIWRQMNGFLFLDAGRVMPGLPDLLRATPHFGGGAGLEIVQESLFRLRAQAATSGEGLFFQLSFEPAYRVQTPAYRI